MTDGTGARVREDETTRFWLQKDKPDLAARVAALHKQRRLLLESEPKKKVEITRAAVAALFVSGQGLEVGAGPRPFPLPDGASCMYGDIRDGEALKAYFGGSAVEKNGFIDAQTFSGVSDNAFDFVISAHVIEHLENPIGSIRNAIRVLRPGGRHILVVPDRRHTFDRHRSPTPLSHLLRDDEDGGASTRLADYKDFILNVGIKSFNNIPPVDINAEAKRLSNKRHDIHFHCWNTTEFRSMLDSVSAEIGFRMIGHVLASNENIFILEKKFN